MKNNPAKQPRVYGNDIRYPPSKRRMKGVKNVLNFPASDCSATTSASRSWLLPYHTTFSVAHPPPTRLDTFCIVPSFFYLKKKKTIPNIFPPLLEIIYFPRNTQGKLGVGAFLSSH